MYHDVYGRASYDADEDRERFPICIEFTGEYPAAVEGAINRACGSASYEGDGDWNRISGRVDRWTYDELTATLKRFGITYTE